MSRLLELLFSFLFGRRRSRTPGPSGDALDDDLLDAWLDEDETDATGL